ncbi:MAG: hypothetical protein ACLQUY_14235 [Ktedonobacterales bacterium]
MMNDSAPPARDFPLGLPVYDCYEEKLGTVSAFGVQSPYLVMRIGQLFHHEVSIPLSAIQRSDARGIHLSRTRQEIHDLTLGGWSSLGNIDLNTGVAAGAATLKAEPGEPDASQEASGVGKSHEHEEK